MMWTGLVVFIVVLALLTCCVSEARRESQLERQDMGRSISDQEYLEACSVKDPNIALKVRKILSDCSGVPEENIHPNDRIVQDLGMY